MKTVSSLLDETWYERYKKISKLNIRSSIYDVTNRCNLRCLYCMPGEGVESVGHDRILSYEEMLRIASAAVRLGIRKIRVTGG